MKHFKSFIDLQEGKSGLKSDDGKIANLIASQINDHHDDVLLFWHAQVCRGKIMFIT
jgi:hypothetical protein